ncbi:hypothetical protein XELAEV_18033165mg [Xenopus laevis]|uniref:Uncharacterized protein n=1 Tax=Xenopus laevis TaxID=8355 RepID=A0A974HDR9_XENLA|nr:hypothetical protein XELAEV_18033165mg [Xenopus laevis]
MLHQIRSLNLVANEYVIKKSKTILFLLKALPDLFLYFPISPFQFPVQKSMTDHFHCTVKSVSLYCFFQPLLDFLFDSDVHVSTLLVFYLYSSHIVFDTLDMLPNKPLWMYCNLYTVYTRV